MIERLSAIPHTHVKVFIRILSFVYRLCPQAIRYWVRKYVRNLATSNSGLGNSNPVSQRLGQNRSVDNRHIGVSHQLSVEDATRSRSPKVTPEARATKRPSCIGSQRRLVSPAKPSLYASAKSTPQLSSTPGEDMKRHQSVGSMKSGGACLNPIKKDHQAFPTPHYINRSNMISRSDFDDSMVKMPSKLFPVRTKSENPISNANIAVNQKLDTNVRKSTQSLTIIHKNTSNKYGSPEKRMASKLNTRSK